MWVRSNVGTLRYRYSPMWLQCGYSPTNFVSCMGFFSCLCTMWMWRWTLLILLMCLLWLWPDCFPPLLRNCLLQLSWQLFAQLLPLFCSTLVCAAHAVQVYFYPHPPFRPTHSTLKLNFNPESPNPWPHSTTLSPLCENEIQHVYWHIDSSQQSPFQSAVGRRLFIAVDSPLHCWAFTGPFKYMQL